jgi:hypothetical protein
VTVIPDKHPFTIWKGSTFYERLTLYTDASRTSYRDLSGHTAKITIQPKDESAIDVDGVITPEDGLIEFTITDEDTALLTWKGANYEMSITHSGITDTLLFGTIKVLHSV